jgi:hypothetical protein
MSEGAAAARASSEVAHGGTPGSTMQDAPLLSSSAALGRQSASRLHAPATSSSFAARKLVLPFLYCMPALRMLLLLFSFLFCCGGEVRSSDR